LDWIKPTLKETDEIWLTTDKNQNHWLYYFKAFKETDKGGFSVVEIDNKGQIRTFYEPKNDNYFNNNRNGVLLYKK
jgi:hypothetical protein